MDKELYPVWILEWNYLSIPKLEGLKRWNFGMVKWFHPTHYLACDYLSMLVLKLIHVNDGVYNMMDVLYDLC